MYKLQREITSRENKNIKDAIKLLNFSKYREKSGEFLAEGSKICEEVLKNDIKIKKVFLTQEFQYKKKVLSETLINCAQESFFVSENILKNISFETSPQGVVCQCAIDKKKQMYKIKEESTEKIIVLEDIQNPLNLGAILRSCDAFGIKDIVLSKKCCDAYNPKVLYGSMGSVLRLNIFEEENIFEFILRLNEYGFKTYASVPDFNAKSILNVDFTGKVAIVIGNEGNGISFDTINVCSEKITIPMKGEAESLNAAVAAGIIIFQANNF